MPEGVVGCMPQQRPKILPAGSGTRCSGDWAPCETLRAALLLQGAGPCLKSLALQQATPGLDVRKRPKPGDVVRRIVTVAALAPATGAPVRLCERPCCCRESGFSGVLSTRNTDSLTLPVSCSMNTSSMWMPLLSTGIDPEMPRAPCSIAILLPGLLPAS